jgi:succinate dehydrogenase/fumarate reductase flavoprotein subunit
MLQENVIETDVLIAGAGIAGIRAAIEAYEQGANVVLSTKGVFGKDGAAVWMAGWGYEAAMYPPDSLEQHAKDTIIGGKFLNNQELVYEFLKLAPQTVAELDRWGVRFGKKEGKFLQARLPGHAYARSVHHHRFGEALGPEYRKALPHQIRLREGIKVLDDMFIIDLLKRDNTVFGAVGLDVKEGELKVIKAKSTILATGGFMACFEFTTANPTLTGDGYGITYRAGARMMDMEFIQFFPTAALWPVIVRGDMYPYNLLIALRGIFYNKLGERFMERYYPVEKDFATREAQARAIFKEVREGRGSPHGGAYVSLRHLPRNLLNDFLEGLKENPFFTELEKAGIDIREDAVEVGPAAHYIQGGCWVNKLCETSLPGLYAIGELGSGGKDGADRLAGNSLPFCMAMGYTAGREAALRAKGMVVPEIDEAQVKDICEQALAPLERSDGIPPGEVKRVVKRLMSSYMVFARKGDELEGALKELERLRAEVLPRLYLPAKERRFNLGWVDALEARNMVDVAEMAMRAALMRRESRGLHERADYPNEEPQWLKHIIIERVDDKMSLTTEPVTFPYLKLS